VAFEVIPAIDVAGGRLARFTSRGAARVDAFGGDPRAAAAAFADAGVRWVHVVDMDLAFGDGARNLDIVADIAGSGLHVQASGAAATGEEVRALLDAGASRAVLGSAALADRALVGELVEELGERLAIGVECDGERIRSRGGRAVDLPLAETLARFAGTAAARFVVTAVARVGELTGPDLDAIRSVLVLGRPVVAAGGIATAADVAAVRETGAEAAILGRAALEGRVDLAELVAEAGR
jgi:phosphoribosylformimino-5-aminoimidazole carboxamide ribonucleotide (ProFAR) isomerase